MARPWRPGMGPFLDFRASKCTQANASCLLGGCPAFLTLVPCEAVRGGGFSSAPNHFTPSHGPGASSSAGASTTPSWIFLRNRSKRRPLSGGAGRENWHAGDQISTCAAHRVMMVGMFMRRTLHRTPAEVGGCKHADTHEQAQETSLKWQGPCVRNITVCVPS